MPKKIYVNFVLDETGSMRVCRDATISGFNEYIQSLRSQQDGNLRFSLTKFNSEKVEVVHDAVELGEVRDLGRDTYVPDYTTPLYDAIMTTIRAMEKAVEGQENVSVLCSIMTDGLENASKEHTRDDVFKTIKEKTAEGWTFTYLGANQDAWAVGITMGIAQGNTMSYAGTAVGTQSALQDHEVLTSAWMAAGARSSTNFYAGAKDEDKEA